jgi:hypothetical protein
MAVSAACLPSSSAADAVAKIDQRGSNRRLVNVVPIARWQAALLCAMAFLQPIKGSAHSAAPPRHHEMLEAVNLNVTWDIHPPSWARNTADQHFSNGINRHVEFLALVSAQSDAVPDVKTSKETETVENDRAVLGEDRERFQHRLLVALAWLVFGLVVGGAFSRRQS